MISCDRSETLKQIFQPTGTQEEKINQMQAHLASQFHSLSIGDPYRRQILEDISSIIEFSTCIDEPSNFLLTCGIAIISQTIIGFRRGVLTTLMSYEPLSLTRTIKRHGWKTIKNKDVQSPIDLMKLAKPLMWRFYELPTGASLSNTISSNPRTVINQNTLILELYHPKPDQPRTLFIEFADRHKRKSLKLKTKNDVHEAENDGGSCE